jgi:CyaY protein
MNPREQEDQAFDRVAEAQLRRLERALLAFDPDELEADLAGDVLTLTLGNGSKIIINRHRAARQIWMAAMRQAWHFNLVPGQGTWQSDKGSEELLSTLENVLTQQLGRKVDLSQAR